MPNASPSLERQLRSVWPAVRRKHLFPELPDPRIAASGPGSGLQIRAKQIVVSRTFVENLPTILDPGDAVEALLDHAVSRYLYCPWNLATHLKLYATARKVLGHPAHARIVTEAFMDIAADTRCVSRVASPLPALYTAVRGDWSMELVKGVLQRIWKHDMGAACRLPVLPQLALLPYLDRPRWPTAIRRFARLLQGHLPSGDDGTPGRCSLSDRNGLASYTAEQVSAGFKDLAPWVDSPAEFMQIADDFGVAATTIADGPERTPGTGAGAGRTAPVFYYMKLAENYRLPLRRMPLRMSGATYPHHHTAWEVGRPCHDIDPWTSFGKIMPGITQIWQREQSEVFAEKTRTPDLIVLIDSSSSMRNPSHVLSYAVLGAGCAADAYLRNGARVAVYNFSDAASGGMKRLSWSTNRVLIFDLLCHYIGGGTRIVPEDLDGWRVDPPADIFLITDLQIRNLSQLIEFFHTCPNRITVVHMGRNTHVYRFRELTGLRSGISLFGVEKREDIPKIVLGKVREYLDMGLH